MPSRSPRCYKGSATSTRRYDDEALQGWDSDSDDNTSGDEEIEYIKTSTSKLKAKSDEISQSKNLAYRSPDRDEWRGRESYVHRDHRDYNMYAECARDEVRSQQDRSRRNAYDRG